ncbi:cytochrome P450 [Mytilinidion resinicola]|uniref:Cytochrome P450 n=1 Tax=Mytilinidion resinicola TaxID=574789 RepID=A0A6A6Y6U0_9PEZI|nr:cytochrome P450 [Mytilinidion resinicola]KAF2804541.1 cytochrome P450 [Mytilinidion resinicola]
MLKALNIDKLQATAVVCSILIAFWGFRLAHSIFILRKVPGPAAARFTNLWRVSFVWSGKAHIKYRKLHEKYGPIVRTGPNVLDISDPSAIPTIYGIKSKYLKSDFYITLSASYEDEVMDSLFSTRDPEYHRNLKRPVTQKYSMTSIRALEHLVDPCNTIFTDAMLDLSGQVVDLGAWLQWYAFDAIGAITFSKRFGFMEERRDINSVIAGIEGGLHYAGIIGQVPVLHQFLLGSRTFRKFQEKLMPNAPNPIKTYDKESSSESEKRSDFLAYLQQQERGLEPQMSTREMMNHLLNNLYARTHQLSTSILAGSDTTAISLRAVFYYVMRDQRIYETLQREIDEADQAGKLSEYITYAESLELEYLQLCIKEAMRMHPGVSYPLERIVPEGGAELCGIHVPAGTTVGVNAATVHRSREVFGQDADEFRPERWSGDPEKTKEMERNLLTFGAGVRTCIGKNISIMEMGKLVPQVLRQFDIEWASSEREWTVTTYWFAKQTGLLVRMKPRCRG